MLKLGDKGKAVEELQILLTHATLGENPLLIDGSFGTKTYTAVHKFQSEKGLVVDGIVGKQTRQALKEPTEIKFMVSIHAGHGGIDPRTGEYATLPSTGKRYRHPASKLMHKNGWFLEGVENRIISESVTQVLRELGVFVLVTNHPYKCDYGNLYTHAAQTIPYIKAGYLGYTHSFHSNAIGQTDKEKMDSVRGGYVFTTKGLTFSDYVAKKLLDLWKAEFGDWVRLRDKGKEPTLSSDAEANFQVLRNIESATNGKFGAILEEFGFFTSEPDAEFITNPQTRGKRVKAAIELAMHFKKLLTNNNNA